MTENIDRLLPAIDDDPPAPPPSDPLLDDYLTPDIVVQAEPPPPLGRSLAVDLTSDWLFVRSGVGPIETRGVDTLQTWVTLCLSTEAGAYEGLPSWFGMVGFSAGLGEHVSSPRLAGRDTRIRDALVRHPRIDDVDYHAEYDPDGVLIEERITVITDDELRVTLTRRA